jgi:peptide/nickel transport system substrate-binding protein
MDPHSLNEALQLSFTGNVYEPLIERDKGMNLAPALATKWTQQSPTVWRFDLRPGVKFHDGTPFPPPTWCSRSSAPPARAPT